mgnify:CR=1 FL=1
MKKQLQIWKRTNLELSGFEVEIANRGDTGLQKAMTEEYDLINSGSYASGGGRI